MSRHRRGTKSRVLSILLLSCFAAALNVDCAIIGWVPWVRVANVASACLMIWQSAWLLHWTRCYRAADAALLHAEACITSAEKAFAEGRDVAAECYVDQVEAAHAKAKRMIKEL